MIFRLLFIVALIFCASYGLFWLSLYRGALTRARMKTVTRVFAVGILSIILTVIVFSFINVTTI